MTLWGKEANKANNEVNLQTATLVSGCVGQVDKDNRVNKDNRVDKVDKFNRVKL